MKTFKCIQKPTNGSGQLTKPGAPSNKTTSNRSATIEEIKRLHDEIVGAARITLDKAIRLGELLTKLKADLGHGNWLSFVESDLPFSERSAQHYLGVYAKRAHLKSATVADMLVSEAYRMVFDETTLAGDSGVSNAASKSPEANQGEVAVSPAKTQAKKRASAPPNFTGADLVGRVKSSREFFESFRKIDPARLADEIKKQLAGEISLLIETCRELAAQLDTSATAIGRTPADLGNKQSEGNLNKSPCFRGGLPKPQRCLTCSERFARTNRGSIIYRAASSSLTWGML